MTLDEIRQIMPEAFDLFGVMTKEVVTRMFITTPTDQAAGGDVFLGGIPPQQKTRCPYCATFDLLTPIHAQLVRASGVGRALQTTYQELALRKAREALAILDDLPPVPDMDTMSLCMRVNEIEFRLTGIMSDGDYAELARYTWETVKQCCILAERFNGADDGIDEVASMVEERVRRVQVRDVVEGEAVEVEP